MKLKKILYITDSSENINTLSSALSGVLQIEGAHPSILDKIAQTTMLFVDLTNDWDKNLSLIYHLKTLSNDSNIPILLNYPKNSSFDFNQIFSTGVSGIVQQPADSKLLHQLLIDYTVRPSEFNSFSLKMNIPFIKATKDVLKNSFGVDIKCVETYAKKTYCPYGEVISEMELDGDFKGTIVFSSSKELAAKLYSQMVGCHWQTLSESDMADCAGEIINQISGRLMSKLREWDFQVKISLPSTFTKFCELTVKTDLIPMRVITFDCMDLPFVLQFSVKITKSWYENKTLFTSENILANL